MGHGVAPRAAGRRTGVLAGAGVLLAAVLATVGFWAWMGRPVAVADTPGDRAECASFTPFAADQSPLNPDDVVRPAHIEAGLQALAGRFSCVRTYAVNQGQDEVVPLARKYGLKVLLGAWIGRDAKSNEREIARVIEVANANPDTVRAVIVGNEVLLRGEMTAARLADAIRQVKSAVSVPVTYADVWEFWIRNPELAREVDFITVHILPFWEDKPESVEDAIPHVRTVLDKVRAAFPGRELFIGETGWPSEGRRRGPAQPGPVEQARYVRDFVTMANAEGLRYNLIEAFDQPWKRALEGTVGGYWGIYTADGVAKFAWTGPVSAWARWPLAAAVALGLGVLPFVGLMAGRRRSSAAGGGVPVSRAVVAAVAGPAAGSALVLGAVFVAVTSLTMLQWAAGVAALAVAAASAWVLLVGGGGEGRTVPDSLIEVGCRIRGRFGVGGCGTAAAVGRGRALVLGALYGAALFAATAVTLGLVFDPRYRDFPTALFLVPAVGFAGLFALCGRDGWRVGLEERGLARLLAGLAVVTVVKEGFGIDFGPLIGLPNTTAAPAINPEALGWIAVALLLAVPGVAGRALGGSSVRGRPPADGSDRRG